ncbi:hypothetical protein BBO99_00006697 [Phytophthora kernoviae]|uniref:SCP domain-containing protein n=2 Tax=Phytophthora kernoviae TaxID=325452 RepID=A0A3R7KS42_9STRA|nr:hypothetical protein G195_003113 [Phytophthora kernoviae 00238/432]KAG2526029.1 hypothetical protein JM16_002509 [Phytophthora kernoviae]KAG2527710.1 hypothetical protein JM18_002317 [Phytophthora kernoviae]RLN10954.1 hypothetical protein BBI17_000751 [Phytophthora kernoviae]RLN77490.1 hypothetical protein BBO99_00006697 [Phytophthora kernoviae]
MGALCPSSYPALLAVRVSSDTTRALSNLRHTPRNLQTYTQNDDYYAKMLDAVNKERAKVGLSALCTNKKLQAAAKRHSDDMAAKDYMDHDGSDGSTMSERITDTGYDWNAVAENVAAGQEDVDSVMVSWMNSEGHRENILGMDYTMFGTSYAYNADSTYKHYWTQDFGAGDTEQCDDASTTTSQSTDQTQQQDEVASEASTSQDTTAAYTSAPATTAPATSAPLATTAPPATEAPTTEAPAIMVPATEAPVAITATPGCKAKK